MRYLRWVLVLVLACWSAAAAGGDQWRPRCVEGFFVEPCRAARLEWTIAGAAEHKPRRFVVRDYAGREVGSGQAEVGLDQAHATVTLAQGFYELELADTHERFGVVAMPACAGPPDPFFAVDGALSWLVKEDAIREGLIRAARRSGIGMIRERLTWGAVHPAADRWDWEGAVRFDTLRRVYGQHGVQVLEMAHDGPAWLGRVGKYPADLVRASDSWQAIARRWKSTWGAVEVWNEPDIFFGDNLPADQYTALVRALAFGLYSELEGRPLVGGVVAHHNPEFLRTAADNGLLDVIDAFSFHTYSHAPEMEKLVAQYRAWLEAAGRPHLPLWLTESGRPWKRGPERPPADQDAASALDITMKAVEARACGVARYFAFVYPYYDENENNFGMMDKRATPLRAMAAYVQAARRLAGADYVGDLPLADARVLRSRVFRQGSTVLAVVYTGKPDSHCRIRFPQGVLWNPAAQGKPQAIAEWQVEGNDGRQLAVDAESNVPVPDGLAYVRLDPAGARGVVKMATAAARLWALGRGHSAPRPAPPGLIPRYEFDAHRVEPTSEGYRLKPGTPETLPFAVRLFNLADRPARLAVRLELTAGKVLGQADRAVEVGSRGSAELRWDIALGGGAGKGPAIEARLVRLSAPGGKPAAEAGGRPKSTLLAVRLLGGGASPEKGKSTSLLPCWPGGIARGPSPDRLLGLSGGGLKAGP